MEDRILNMDSVQDYIRKHIIERVKSLLSEHDKTVSQTVHELGYKHPQTSAVCSNV